MQIKPLVNPTRKIISFRGLEYAWHDYLQEYIFFPHTYAYALFYFFVSPIGPYNINVLNLNPFLKFLCVCCDYVLDVGWGVGGANQEIGLCIIP